MIDSYFVKEALIEAKRLRVEKDVEYAFNFLLLVLSPPGVLSFKDIEWAQQVISDYKLSLE